MSLIQTKSSKIKNDQSTKSRDRQPVKSSDGFQTTNYRYLQNTFGNQFLQKNVFNNFIQRQVDDEDEENVQTKLTVSQPGDKYEKEANEMAEKVMTMPEPDLQHQQDEEEEEQLQTKVDESIQRQVDDDEEEIQMKLDRQTDNIEENEEEIQTKPVSDNHKNNHSSLKSQLNSLNGSGTHLPKTTRTYFETRFNTNFKNVKVHNNPLSDSLNQQLNARAFTNNNNIYFRSGEYNPVTHKGRKLLAHELTHVLQQVNRQNRNNIQRGENEAKQAGNKGSNSLGEFMGIKIQAYDTIEEWQEFLKNADEYENNFSLVVYFTKLLGRTEVTSVLPPARYTPERQKQFEMLKVPDKAQGTKLMIAFLTTKEIDVREMMGFGHIPALFPNILFNEFMEKYYSSAIEFITQSSLKGEKKYEIQSDTISEVLSETAPYADNVTKPDEILFHTILADITNAASAAYAIAVDPKKANTFEYYFGVYRERIVQNAKAFSGLLERLDKIKKLKESIIDNAIDIIFIGGGKIVEEFVEMGRALESAGKNIDESDIAETIALETVKDFTKKGAVFLGKKLVNKDSEEIKKDMKNKFWEALNNMYKQLRTAYGKNLHENAGKVLDNLSNAFDYIVS
ncbi:DUF4157 domain-containing protein [candidate division KSB1 bacterium]|nr:DUF4157 domain-containing protein [candidate division KSB1 bacterium]